MDKAAFTDALADSTVNIGDDVWFTCVAFSPKSMSLVRHVKPLKVRINDWPGYKTFYFLGVKANGQTDARQFHTFYRFFQPPQWDLSAEVFFTEAEAQVAYKRQLIPMKQLVQETWDARLAKLENLKTMLSLDSGRKNE
jgi:hypothetical protein